MRQTHEEIFQKGSEVLSKIVHVLGILHLTRQGYLTGGLLSGGFGTGGFCLGVYVQGGSLSKGLCPDAYQNCYLESLAIGCDL